MDEREAHDLTCRIEFSKAALERSTIAQINAVCRMADHTTGTTRVDVITGTSDLPGGYVTFTRHYRDGAKIYGGIAPDGSVST
jgi:hypothetical protein